MTNRFFETVRAFCARHAGAILCLTMGACSRGQERPSDVTAAPSPPAVSEAERQQVLGAMPPLIDAHYVFPEVGTKTIAALRQHVAHGDYASLTGGEQFARALSHDLQDVSHDKHFVLRYFSGSKEGPSEEEEAEHARVLANAGFVTIERLPGNVAVLRVDCFERSPNERLVVEAYAKNMTAVADASAMVLDLRENHGGDPATVALLLSYLFDATPVHINDIWDRDAGRTWHSWTRADVAGERFGPKKPLFVVTSKETISGGEEAAYDLQALKRAVIVGETTVGGANPASRYSVSDHFVFSVPTGRAINPITHTNWEGVGVIPDVPVSAAAAVHEAHVRAVRALIAERTEGPARAELEKVLAGLSDPSGATAH